MPHLSCLYSGDVNYCKVTLNTDDVSVGIVVGKVLHMPLLLSLCFIISADVFIILFVCMHIICVICIYSTAQVQRYTHSQECNYG